MNQQQQQHQPKYLYYSNQFIWNLHYPGGAVIHRLVKLLPTYYYERAVHRLAYQNDKRFNFNYGAGFSHNYSYLIRYIREAILHNRTAVIHPMICDVRHNFNHLVANNWQDYYDLDKSSIIYDDGRKIALPYIKSTDFLPLLRSANDHVLVINYADAIQPQDNSNYRFIVRRIAPTLWLRKVSQDVDFEVSLEETAAITNIGDAIINQLGDFYLLHYRYPDHWPFKGEYPQEYLSLLDIDTLAKKLQFPANSTLYVMANIWRQPDYFAKLKQKYRVATYQDFPELRQLIEGDHPNTFLLFAIEKYLMKKALDWTAVNRSHFLSK